MGRIPSGWEAQMNRLAETRALRVTAISLTARYSLLEDNELIAPRQRRIKPEHETIRLLNRFRPLRSLSRKARDVP